jgi:glycosyltransferase involved in cell wall biosynthesis
MKPSKQILWWGRFDPDYSRNRILRSLLIECGFDLQDFIPRSSFFGTIEAAFSRITKPAAVWVPSFRQRDYFAARRFSDKHGIPLVFDPLISAWDKAVFETKKFEETSRKSTRLLSWERSLFSGADLVIADTSPHARFFIEKLSAPGKRTYVIPVGAEESLFKQQKSAAPAIDSPP